MNIESIEIKDPLKMAARAAIEVDIKTTNGENRWCFFFTPEGIAACGDFIEGTDVRIHHGASHMIVVSEISEKIIEAALKDIENRGVLRECTRAFNPE